MKPAPLADIAACVFDAYGTLFDFNAAAERCRDALGDKAAPLSAVWRAKQLEYTWLRSLMGRHADFWQVTGEALDFSLAVQGIEDNALRARLLDCYRTLDAYPDAKDTLARLRVAGMATGILSNGTPAMLESAIESAGLGSFLDAVLSVEDVGIYKPHPSVYRLAVERLGVPAERICFLSSNGWDARGAAAYGFRVVWVNRLGQQPDNLPEDPIAVVASLDALPALLGC